jgi:hypothetical protein
VPLDGARAEAGQVGVRDVHGAAEARSERREAGAADDADARAEEVRGEARGEDVERGGEGRHGRRGVRREGRGDRHGVGCVMGVQVRDGSKTTGLKRRARVQACLVSPSPGHGPAYQSRRRARLPGKAGGQTF